MQGQFRQSSPARGLAAGKGWALSLRLRVPLPPLPGQPAEEPDFLAPAQALLMQSQLRGSG